MQYQMMAQKCLRKYDCSILPALIMHNNVGTPLNRSPTALLEHVSHRFIKATGSALIKYHF